MCLGLSQRGLWLPRGQQCSAGIHSSTDFIAPSRMEAAQVPPEALQSLGSPGATQVTVIPPIPRLARGAEQGMAAGGEMCFILLRVCPSVT